MTIISGENATSNLTIQAPTGATQFPKYFLDLIRNNGLTGTPEVISIAFPTGASGFNLTSFGKTDVVDGFTGTIWRLRNGKDVATTGSLSPYGSGVSNSYNLAANTDTFVFSSVSNGAATHILTIDGEEYRKASSQILFRNKDDDRIDGDAYEIIGGSGDDELIGANLDDTLRGRNGNDTLEGGDGRDRLFGQGGNDFLIGEDGNDLLFGGGGIDTLEGSDGNDLLVGGNGNDSLTGDGGRDRFRFTNGGMDLVTDFNLGDRDAFQFRVDRYNLPADAPLRRDEAVVGTVGTVSTPEVNVYVDELTNIVGATGSVYFAYATDTNELFYDADGIWSSGRVKIANTNDFGSPTADNFNFV